MKKKEERRACPFMLFLNWPCGTHTRSLIRSMTFDPGLFFLLLDSSTKLISLAHDDHAVTCFLGSNFLTYLDPICFSREHGLV